MHRVVLVGLAAWTAAADSKGCTELSANLPAAECASWQNLYDAITWPAAPKPPPHAVNEEAAPSPPPRPQWPPSRANPCGSLKYILCTEDGSHILGIDLGGRELGGTLPSADKLSGFSSLSYLMLAYNNFTGALPALDYSKITGCGYGYGATGNSCCFLSSTVSNVYDEDKDTGITNQFSCPLPAGAAESCHATCADANGRRHGYGIDVFPSAHSERAKKDQSADIEQRREAAAASSSGTKLCQQCTPASPAKFPQCDVKKSLLWYKGHISNAFCTDKELVVFSNAIPNHAVSLEEMPKPPGAGPQAGDYSVRVWNTQSYAYRIPLVPKYMPDTIVNYTGAGALAMTTNGVSMYPIMSPGVAAIDPEHKWRDGHTRADNMKLDGQLDRCNEHAGRGFDIHYHGDPSCMYNESSTGHSPIIGWAADGFALYGKYNASGGEPDDLDRCNGHIEDIDGSGKVEYHYHVSPRFPYTIACWHGDVRNISYTNGGQPGQKQWAFDNARTRAMADREALLPCCSDEDAVAPTWVEALEPYAPIDHDNVHIHRAAVDVAAKAAKTIWMYARHGDWGADEVGRMDNAAASAVASQAHKADDYGYVVCSGKSLGMLQADCQAWQDLYDATGGNTTWIECATLRADPCSCVTDNGEVACGAELSADDGVTAPALRLVTLGLQVNGLSGALPESLAKMTALTDIQLAGNAINVPNAKRLGGKLPESLPYDQYVGCGLEGNDWACPLPANAVKYCSAGQALTCVNADGSLPNERLSSVFV